MGFKRSSSTLVAVALLTPFAGCGSGSTPNAKTVPSPSAEQAETAYIMVLAFCIAKDVPVRDLRTSATPLVEAARQTPDLVVQDKLTAQQAAATAAAALRECNPSEADRLLRRVSGGPAENENENEDASSAPGSRDIAATSYPDGEWPLSAKHGTVRCDGGSVIFRSRTGKDYAVNGTALTQHPGMARIHEIWLPNPDIPGTKVNISPVLDAGLDLC